MRHARAITFATASVAVFTTFGLYARQDAQEDQVPVFQVEQTPSRTAGATATTYIVRLERDPVVKYRGGDPRFPATAPARGRKLDPNDAAVRSYAAYLDGTHDDVLRTVGGGRKLYDYRYAVNGFTAVLTPAQAAQLAQAPGVASVEPDIAAPLETVTSPAFLGLDAPGGLWEQLGGVENAGEDIIIGMVDGGVWPEHPSFSDRTGANKNGVGAKLSYQQIPGWHGKCTPGEAFNASMCNQKLIGAQYFVQGRLAVLTVPDYEYLSPRDYGGHGTHTSSTAGGNAGVQVPASSGKMSGIAPRARIATYKVCFDDGAGNGTCFNSDSVAAIDQAVIDGVDVINFSIGGTSSFFTNVVEVAFFNAAEAGVFVAAAGGNSGPTASTVAHPSPWITTVAATTHPRSGTTTLTLGNGVTYTGASTAAATPSLPMVLSVNVGLPNGNNPATPENEVALCFSGTLDPAKVAGRMVVCDRGVNARVDKSLAVAMAGGLGMVLVNVAGGATDIAADFHSVPTIHLPAANEAAIKSYVGTSNPTGRLAAAVITPTGPAPAVASFSSRGPLIAAGGDLLKPDVSAPGVDVLAGVAPPGNGGALFALYQGTSMASPHVAGLAALLKQLHPDWSPMMIKSALMTTATQMAGAANTAPFNVGSGLINPTAAMDPGLGFDSTAAEWLAFVCGTGEIPAASCTAAGVTPINPNSLNTPSIAVARATETLSYVVTRRVMNVSDAAATYTPSVTPITGFTSSVSPSALSIAPGETKSFTLTLTRTGTAAPFDQYQIGALTWNDGRHNVRVPIVIKPVQLVTTGAIIGTGPAGAITFTSFAGYSGPYSVVPHGLVPDTRTTGTVADDPNNSFDTTPANLTTQAGVSFHDIVVPAGQRYVRFALFDPFTDGNDDLDLVVYAQLVANGPFLLVGGTGGATSNEALSVINPPAALFRVFVHGFETDGPDANYTLFHWIVPEAASGNLTASAPSSVTEGNSYPVTASWQGLTPGLKYLGTLTHHRLAAPVPGSPRIGHTSVFIDVP
jgi:subtilisin family serine protease